MPARPFKAVVLAALKLSAHAHCPLGDHCLTKSVFVCLCITNSNVGGKKKRGFLLTLPFIYISLQNPITPSCPGTLQLLLHHRPDRQRGELYRCRFEKWIYSSSPGCVFPADRLLVIPLRSRVLVSYDSGICYLLLLKENNFPFAYLSGRREWRDNKDVTSGCAVGLHLMLTSLPHRGRGPSSSLEHTPNRTDCSRAPWQADAAPSWGFKPATVTQAQTG